MTFPIITSAIADRLETFSLCRELGFPPKEDTVSARQLAERAKNLETSLQSKDPKPAIRRAKELGSLGYVYGRQRKFSQSKQMYELAEAFVLKAAAPLNSILHSNLLRNQSDMLARMGQQKSAFEKGVRGATEMHANFAPLEHAKSAQ